MLIKEIPAPEPKQITAIIKKQPYDHWWEAQNAPEWALFFLTIPYVLVTIGLFVVTKRASNAAKNSAAAALESAKAANLALHADRPLVIVKEITMNVDRGGCSLTPHVIFRNYGHSPAILIDVYLGLQTVSGDALQNLTGDIVKQWQYMRHQIQKQVLGGGGITEETITTKWLAPKVFAEVLNRETAQVAHGLVRYRGTFELPKPYESHFCWFYIPPYDGSPNGYFVIGPKELNQTT